MTALDPDTLTDWWRRLAPRLDREAIAAALLGADHRRTQVAHADLRRRGITATSGDQRRALAAAVITDPAGHHLPLAERIAVARTCSAVTWTELARILRDDHGAEDREVDRWLAEAGASVAQRLEVWGLTRT